MSFLVLLIKYLIFYIYLYFSGKSLFLIINYFRKKEFTEKYILLTRVEFLYPLLGIIFVGNILFLINTFFPLDNIFVNLIIFLIIAPSIAKSLINKNIMNVVKNNNLFSTFIYIFIPSILVISTFDINFNYDAGYYHLLHQNWLRSSNLIVGMVNIFWPLGMSSIYEYISAILWFDTSFVLLHFLNLYFIHFFYLFISDNLINSKNNILRNVSIFILIYSLIDNFGIGGGRNGFLYIQGVGKQDITVGVLFFYLSIVILLKIKEKNISKTELIILSFIIFFIYQIKVSGVIIFYLYAILLLILLKENKIKLSSVLLLHSPILFFGILWTLKSFFTTGCLIYPVNFTCYEGFDWYIKGSTTEFEYITKSASLAFDNSVPFLEWARVKGSFEYRSQVFINYIVSLIVLYLFKLIFFYKNKLSISDLLIISSFIISNFAYLIFFGPIPRYAVGICLVSVAVLGFYSGEFKYRIKDIAKYSLLFVSVFFLVRSTAYLALINNENLRLFDPRTSYEINTEIGFKQFNENWVEPLDGDQCWSNIKCTNALSDIVFINKGIFKVAYK
ncbi:hypothetical protein OBA39_02840 [Acidimicrobiaceae bacterium]|nr:hypothetical protein [Acidimicrobiaceae bacterium]